MTKTSATASARKSLGEYKPLIVYPDGSTEVCEQSPERADRHTKYGVIKGNRKARGTTYKTRAEAIAVAQAWIDARRAEAITRFAKYSAFDKVDPEVLARTLSRIRQEIAMWGGETGE